MTGANSGIGKSIAEEIAKRGGTLHLVCRNVRTAEEAKEEIVKATGNEVLYYYIFFYSQFYKYFSNFRMSTSTSWILQIIPVLFTLEMNSLKHKIPLMFSSTMQAA